jgi:transcription elongation regulator 1
LQEKEKEREAEKLAKKRKRRSSSHDGDSSSKKRSRKDKKKDGDEDGIDDKKTKEEGEVGDESQPEDGEKPSTPVDDGLTDEQRERVAKEREALAARTAQVQAELAGADKVRSAQAEKQRQVEAEDTYRSILTDHIKPAQVSVPYKECRRLLRKDERYAAVSETLDKTVKERLFEDHMRVLLKKRHDQLKTILAEINTITLTTRWHDAKKTIREDERLKKMYGSDERVRRFSIRRIPFLQTLEREFRDYIEDRVSQAKNDFRQLLRETKIVTHK